MLVLMLLVWRFMRKLLINGKEVDQETFDKFLPFAAAITETKDYTNIDVRIGYSTRIKAGTINL